MPSRVSVVENEHGDMLWLSITNVRSKIMTIPMPYNIHDGTDNCCEKSDMSLSPMIENTIVSPESRSAKVSSTRTFVEKTNAWRYQSHFLHM